MNKVFLIGLPASGKTTTGKWLADKMGWDFLDLDQVIVQETGKSIFDIFEKEGEDAFRDIEADCLRKTKDLTRMVIACGGGTASYLSNMDWMISNGMTVFLNPEIRVISQRLEQDSDERPLFARLKSTEIERKLLNLLEERAIFYSKSKIVWNKSQPNDILYFAVSQLIGG
jgi:shikimate kinase